MKGYLVGKAVLAMKRHGVRIVLSKEREGVYQWVGIAKEAIYALPIGLVNVFKAVGGGFGIFFHQRLCYDKVLHAIFAWVLKGLLAYHAVLAHGGAHLKGGVYQYAVGAPQLFGVHTAH